MKTNDSNRVRLILSGIVGLVLAALCGPLSASAQDFSVQYFDTTDGQPSNIRLWNPTVTATAHRLCEMIYVFDSHEELQECCGCPMTDNGLRSLQTTVNLTANPLGPQPGGAKWTSGVIKIVTTGVNSSSPPYAPCNAAFSSSATLLSPIPGWIIHSKVVGAFDVGTESAFTDAPLSTAELNSLSQNCAFIHTNGTGRGLCTCGVGDNLPAGPKPGTR